MCTLQEYWCPERFIRLCFQAARSPEFAPCIMYVHMVEACSQYPELSDSSEALRPRHPFLRCKLGVRRLKTELLVQMTSV